MKTKEIIFYEATGRQFHRFAFGPAILEAMQLYSDQQNKELRERLAQEDEKAIFIERANAEIQRLTKDVQNLINERDEIKRIGYANKGAYESIEQNDKRELTRLRELLVEWRKWHMPPKALKDKIDNALNHKP